MPVLIDTHTLIAILDTTAGPLILTDGPALALDHLTRGALFAAPGLAVEGDLDLLLTTGETGPRACRLTLATPLAPDDTPIWDLTGRGELHRVAVDAGGQPVEDLSERTLLTAGRLDEAAVDEHTTSISIIDDTEEDRGLLLDAGAVVSPETWPRTDAQRATDGAPAYVGSPEASQPAVELAPYPVLIGRPGQGIPYRTLGASWSGAAPCSPALLVETTPSATAVDDHVLIVSAGRIDATTVRRLSTDQNGSTTAEDCAVDVAHDRQGRLVSVISPQSALDIPTEDAESWVCLTAGDGIADPYGTGPLRRADHVLRWALDRSTLRYDRRQLPRLGALRGYLIDVAIYSQARPWDWIRSQLLPHLPLAVATGPAGLYLWPRLATPTHADAVAELRVGVACTRLSPVLASPLDPVERVTVAYAWDARAGRAARRATVAGRRLPHDGADVLLDYWASRAAQTRPPGALAAVELEVPVTSDPTTAIRVAQDHLAARCRPTYSTDLAVEQAVDLLPGDVVRVVDDALRLDVAAQVERVSYAGGAALLTVRWAAQVGRQPSSS
jgi:hypothetical protein